MCIVIDLLYIYKIIGNHQTKKTDGIYNQV